MRDYDKSAADFGVGAFKAGSVSGYSDALKAWHANPKNPYSYKRISGREPNLLKKLVK